ncbi:DUF2000 domain-containing protein [Tistrella mobilis]|uniref:DUF2000 domain-containing protein n=1 Tax=Tistrella mobilis (strain KA081020-065) TaxID=1110502 RepID=I3TX70_TISMK|nr:DUF2000 domain-containing protein [Tistrella mobilis]AFK57358.1 hypothetical protein TMO_c0748 [Tistrella mobilis KA081020-065]
MTAADTRIAIVIDPALPAGLLANTIAGIAIGLGSARPALGAVALTDAAGRRTATITNLPVPVLQAPAEVIRGLLLKALPAPEEAVVVPFPAFARSLHVFADYVAAFPDRDLGTESIDGVGLVGPGKWVRSLTGSLKLLR